MPRDPQRTSERAVGGTIRVGIIDAAPWAALRDGRAEGAECDLVMDFARAINARVEWLPGGESRLMQALENFELDLVVGGVEDDTAWKERVGLTRPYLRSETIIAGPPGTDTRPPELKGRNVAIAEADPARRSLRERGAVPVDPGTPGTALAAVETWALPESGLVAVGVRLRTARHVFAAPPGENGWLLRLDRFLHEREADVPELLRRAARVRTSARPPA